MISEALEVVGNFLLLEQQQPPRGAGLGVSDAVDSTIHNTLSFQKRLLTFVMISS